MGEEHWLTLCWYTGSVICWLGVLILAANNVLIYGKCNMLAGCFNLRLPLYENSSLIMK